MADLYSSVSVIEKDKQGNKNEGGDLWAERVTPAHVCPLCPLVFSISRVSLHIFFLPGVQEEQKVLVISWDIVLVAISYVSQSFS